MKINTLTLLFKDALKSIKRNAVISIASIATVMVTLFVLGLFLICLLNIKLEIIAYANPKLEMQVLLNNNIKIAEQKKIYNKIKSIPCVTSIYFQDKKQTAINLKKKLGDKSKFLLLSYVKNNNTLPASYVIKANTPDNVTAIISELNGIQGITEIDSGEEIIKKLSKITKVAQQIGTTIFIISAITTIILISNTIKLAAYSRREEIKIMKSIGATDWFITCPFIFDGMIIGFCGSAMAILEIYLLYNFIYKKVTSYSISTFLSLVNPSFILTAMSWSFILIGTFITAMISYSSIQKFLKVQ
ncbi:permease-like cell division protein FtsX [Clostridium neuense]|uniref:Cell division protein FtsX n=1 Tax=Clostridium neuense TaxID=1728934 RepID=A0ABW8TCE3_9CLOT